MSKPAANYRRVHAVTNATQPIVRLGRGRTRTSSRLGRPSRDMCLAPTADGSRYTIEGVQHTTHTAHLTHQTTHTHTHIHHTQHSHHTYHTSFLNANHSPLRGFQVLVDTVLESPASALSNAVSTTIPSRAMASGSGVCRNELTQ